MSVLFILSVWITVVFANPSDLQLQNFINKSTGSIGILTTTGGSPVEVRDTVAFSSQLLRNSFFMDTMTGFVRERIPDRIVHAKGAGAFGYFEVTHNVTDICKAKLFSEVGKKTSVDVRFSHGFLQKGEADATRDSRGLAIKFHTEDGSFDLLTSSTPMFMTKDALLFKSITHTVNRNPVTNLIDRNMIWDLMTQRPEIVFFFMYIFGDNGIPISYSLMPGYSIHTYQVVNDRGESHFVRFNFIPDAGEQSFVSEEEIKIAKSCTDYLADGLYNDIGNGKFPSWTLKVQVLSLEDVKKADFDVFDVTKVLPVDKYPLRPIGKLVLNRNPSNYFVDVEQAAFCPTNLVPGILGAPDKLFEARLLVYREARAYRLGVKASKMNVYCPYSNGMSMIHTGRPHVDEFGGGSPGYYPRVCHDEVPYKDSKKPELLRLFHNYSHNFDQESEWFNGLSSDAQRRMVRNMVTSLSKVSFDVLRRRAIKLFKTINTELGRLVSEELKNYSL